MQKHIIITKRSHFIGALHGRLAVAIGTAPELCVQKT